MTLIDRTVSESAALVVATEAFIRLDWQPDKVRACRNCSFALVHRGERNAPLVSCAKGHGGPIELIRLIRKSGRGFRSAVLCPDFAASYDDDE